MGMSTSSDPLSELAVESLMNRLIEVLVAAEADSADQPHVVITTTDTGITSFIGPFDCAMSAMTATEEMRTQTFAGEPGVSYSVAQLLPPV